MFVVHLESDSNTTQEMICSFNVYLQDDYIDEKSVLECCESSLKDLKLACKIWFFLYSMHSLGNLK